MVSRKKRTDEKVSVYPWRAFEPGTLSLSFSMRRLGEAVFRLVCNRYPRSRIICSLAALSLLMSVTVAAPQENKNTPASFSRETLAELQKIQRVALESDYAYRQLSHLSNNIGPRLSGSPQAQKAVEYVADQMRRLGADVQLEKLMVPHWVRGEETAALVEYPGQAPNTPQKVVLTALGSSVATPSEGITAEVVVVNSFDELAALGREKIAGKIVLFNARFDKQMAAQGFAMEAYGQAVIYRAFGPSGAARLGAIAALIRSVGGADYRLPHTGGLRYAEDAPKIPGAAVTSEDADLIARLTSEGKVRMRVTLTPQTLPDAPSYNVIADFKGTEHPEQLIIVSGHLDSWDLGTGAIDDGAGVVIAMQAIQLLKQLGLRPKRTIRMIAWMNEENGVVGARTYAEEHASDMANHFAAIESDHGAGHPLGFVVTGEAGILPMLAQVSTILEPSGATLMKLGECEQTDIAPLSAAGVPAFGLWQDGRTYFNYHHTAADTFDKVEPRALAENAAAMAVLAYALANLQQALPRELPRKSAGR